MSCLATGYACYEIMQALYERKYSIYSWRNILSFLIYIILNVLIAYIQIPVLNILYSLTALCIMSCFLFKVQIKKVIMNSIFIILYLAILDLSVTLILSILSQNSTYNALKDSQFFMISGIVNAIAILCTYSIVIHVLLHCQVSDVSKAQHIYMIFLLIFEIGVLCYFIREGADIQNNIPLLLVSCGFIGVNAGFLQFYKLLSHNAFLEKQAELLQQQKELVEKYYEGLHDRYEKTEKLIHDFKKHLSVLEGLGKINSDSQREYAEELNATLSNIQEQFKCSDKIVNAIIWDKIQICYSEGILFERNMQDLNFDFMDKIDVTILFANLLDNAIEACRMSSDEEKIISLRTHKFKEYIVIRMKNTLGRVPIIKNGKLISTKPEHCGLGMVILDNLANKYSGNINYDYTDKFFETKIILFACEPKYNKNDSTGTKA